MDHFLHHNEQKGYTKVSVPQSPLNQTPVLPKKASIRPSTAFSAMARPPPTAPTSPSQIPKSIFNPKTDQNKTVQRSDLPEPKSTFSVAKDLEPVCQRENELLKTITQWSGKPAEFQSC